MLWSRSSFAIAQTPQAMVFFEHVAVLLRK